MAKLVLCSTKCPSCHCSKTLMYISSAVLCCQFQHQGIRHAWVTSHTNIMVLWLIVTHVSNSSFFIIKFTNNGPGLSSVKLTLRCSRVRQMCHKRCMWVTSYVTNYACAFRSAMQSDMTRRYTSSNMWWLTNSMFSCTHDTLCWKILN